MLSVLLRQQRWAGAFELLSTTLPQLNTPTKRDEATYNRAIAARRVARNEIALSDLIAYIGRHPRDPDAHFIAGLCAAALDRRAPAAVFFERYLASSGG